MICYVLEHLNGLLAELMDFVKPFFIAVFAFAIPFLYTARLEMDRRYGSTLVSGRLAASWRYGFFRSMNIVSFVFILSYLVLQNFVHLSLKLYFACCCIVLIVIVLYFFSIIYLYKEIVKLGEFKYTSNLIKRNITAQNILQLYKEKFDKTTKKTERRIALCYRLTSSITRFFKWNIRLFTRITAFVRAKNGITITRIKNCQLKRMEAIQKQTDLDNQMSFNKTEKIWDYSIINQDLPVFISGYEACKGIFTYYQYISINDKIVNYPQWLYDKIFTILNNALTNERTRGFDVQLVSLISLYVDTTNRIPLSFKSLHEINRVLTVAIENRRESFISNFFKWAEQYYLDILQYTEVADWNRREDNSPVPFIDNASLIFALNIYVLRAKLFALHLYNPLLETDYYTGIQTSYSSKHLYRMGIEDILQLYLTAHYAFTGYSFLLSPIYPYLFLEKDTLLKEIDEYTAFLLLKGGKQELEKKVNVTLYDIPNELIKRYFDNLKSIVAVLKRDFRLMGMFRLDDSIADSNLNKLEATLIASKRDAAINADISPEKEAIFVAKSKEYINNSFAPIASLINKDDAASPNDIIEVNFAPIITPIDKRAFIERPDLDASSLLDGPSHMYVINLKHQLYKFISSHLQKDKVFYIETMNLLEQTIDDIVNNSANDYLFIDCQLPYYFAKKEKKLVRTQWSYSYAGEEFVQETGAYYLENLQDCLLIIKKNEVFFSKDKQIENDYKTIGDDFFNSAYSINSNEQNIETNPLVNVGVAMGVNLFINPNAEVFLIRVGKKD